MLHNNIIPVTIKDLIGDCTLKNISDRGGYVGIRDWNTSHIYSSYECIGYGELKYHGIAGILLLSNIKQTVNVKVNICYDKFGSHFTKYIKHTIIDIPNVHLKTGNNRVPCLGITGVILFSLGISIEIVLTYNNNNTLTTVECRLFMFYHPKVQEHLDSRGIIQTVFYDHIVKVSNCSYDIKTHNDPNIDYSRIFHVLTKYIHILKDFKYLRGKIYKDARADFNQRKLIS